MRRSERSAIDVCAPLQRLAEAGARLQAASSEAEWGRALTAETAGLLGARRVLVVLSIDAALSVAAARLPARESSASLLAAVTPWLDEALSTRAIRLRHGPVDAAPREQRSCLVAPLFGGKDLLGVVYADTDGRIGRFGDNERDALAVLASQAAAALAHLRAM